MSLLLVQAVNLGGRSYDICVKLWGSGGVLLLVENFDDVKAPGLLTQAAQTAAGCPGCLEDEEESIYGPSRTHWRKKAATSSSPMHRRKVSHVCHGAGTFQWDDIPHWLLPPTGTSFSCLPCIGLIAVKGGLHRPPGPAMHLHSVQASRWHAGLA